MARIKLVIPGVLQSFRGENFSLVDMRADPVYAPSESFFAMYKPSVNETMDLVAYYKSLPHTYTVQEYGNDLIRFGVPEDVD